MKYEDNIEPKARGKFQLLFKPQYQFLPKSNAALLIFLTLTLILFALNSCSENPIDAGENKKITPPVIPPLYFSYPAWHSTSNWIAVVHSDSVDTNNDGIDDDYFSGIWLIDSETGQKKPFLEIGDAWLAWNKDGKKLAIEMGGQIYTIDVPSVDPVQIDTASLTQLTFEDGNYFPSFSPDGQWIVYDSGKDSPGPNYIWKMRVDGSEKKCISIKGTGEWRMPDWSSRDNLIVYQRYVGVGGAEVFIMDSSGSFNTRLTNDLNHDQYPRFSNSGEIIGFLSQPLNGPRVIRLINSDGTGLRRISPDWAYLFDFSPDGSKIAFVLYGPDSLVAGNGQLWTMNSDGSNLIQLTNFKP